MPAKHQILVEGVNDQHVVGQLLKQYNITCELVRRGALSADNDERIIREAGGYENLLNNLEVRLDEPFLERLAIIVDADTDIQGRWESLRNRLSELDADTIPANFSQEGTFTTVRRSDRDVQVGIWLMPNNELPGRLETFASYLMQDSDVLWPHAREIVDGLPERRFQDIALEKAYVATWLAWQAEPGMQLGVAVSAHLLDAHADLAQQLVNWIKRLFDLP